jgi:hypothetical protein
MIRAFQPKRRLSIVKGHRTCMNVAFCASEATRHGLMRMAALEILGLLGFGDETVQPKSVA